MVEKPNYQASVPNVVVRSPSHSSLVNLSLSVCLTHTEFVWINIFLISIYIKQGQRQASHLEAGDGYRIDRISDSGVRFEKHKCCLDFKHSEW